MASHLLSAKLIIFFGMLINCWKGTLLKAYAMVLNAWISQEIAILYKDIYQNVLK